MGNGSICRWLNSLWRDKKNTRMKIFDVPIDNLSKNDIIEIIKQWLLEGGFHRITTINPEFLLLAHSHPKFRQALQSADLRIADGVGINFPFWLAGEKLIVRFPGTDLLDEILQIAETKGYGVALALYEQGLSNPVKIKTALLERYPKLQVEMLSLREPQSSQAAILFCNYGAPLQELYLETFRTRNTSFRLVMGVGGAFDFLTGAISRAPKWMRSLGLEWLWRLMQQPSRFKRIWNAVVVFPIKVLSQK